MPDPSDSPPDNKRAASSMCWLELDVVVESPEWSDPEGLERAIAASGQALARLPLFAGRAPARACIALADDATAAALNKAYRGKDKPTNVLSFPAPAVDGGRGPASLGDVVLAFGVVSDEARRDGISLVHHVQHLVVHGLLHLMGYDHETDADAAVMETLEIAILDRLGLANPYAEEPGSVAHAGGLQ